MQFQFLKEYMTRYVIFVYIRICINMETLINFFLYS